MESLSKINKDGRSQNLTPQIQSLDVGQLHEIKEKDDYQDAYEKGKKDAEKTNFKMLKEELIEKTKKLEKT